MYYELTDHFRVAADIDRTWSFFCDAESLPRITPAGLGFDITSPRPITIQQDTVLDYRIRAVGLWWRWRTRIIDWSPKRQFVDLQTRGPYALWHHQHRFEPDGAGGVLCWDRVIYKLPMGPIGRLVHSLAVRGQLMEIFRYRRTAIGQHLGALTPVQPDVQIRAFA